MSKHVTIWEMNPNFNDTIEVFTKEPISVVSLSRNDMKFLHKIKQANKSGIYILRKHNSSKVYVGQANNVIDRIRTHDREKDWWDNVLFFVHNDKQLDPSQLNYLEKRLIQTFKAFHFEVTNVSSGNGGYISEYAEHMANEFWKTAFNIISNYMKINLFEKVSVNNSRIQTGFQDSSQDIDIHQTNDVNVERIHQSDNTYLLTDSIGSVVENNLCLNAYIDWVAHLSGVPEYYAKFINMRNNKSYGIFFQEPCEKRGLSKFTEIDDELYIYNSLNDNRKIFYKIDKICEALKIKATVSKSKDGIVDVIYSDKVEFRAIPLLKNTL